MHAKGNVNSLRLPGLLALLVLCLSLAADAEARQPAAYKNPVSRGFADTFADPAVIKGKDGYWYAFGTTDPLKEGQNRFRTIPISRSRDLVEWRYVGDAFDSASDIDWADMGEEGNPDDDARLWAPDIRYVDGTYYLYYVVTQTTVTDGRNDNAIGVATAPTPTGPWRDSGDPVVEPRPGDSGNPDDFEWTFDPNEFTDSDGTRYLYYGSYYGGIFVDRLTESGTEVEGNPTQVATNDRYEGAYVVKRDGYYYLFGSSANCCAGPTTGYSVYVGRSESPRGPFLDREGASMLESRVGGTIVVTPNGNRWVGTGHNAVVTDLSGEDFFVYHALDRRDPYLNGTGGINERPMLIDRLDWIDGWPTVRGGRWASAGAERAPVTDGPVEYSFNRTRSLGDAWRPKENWSLERGDDQSRRYVRQNDASGDSVFLINRQRVPDDLRAEADLRLDGGSATGAVVRYADRENYAVAWLDRAQNALVTDAVVAGTSTGPQSTPLPPGFPFGEWHNVAVELRGQQMTVRVTDARLHDPYAVAERTLPDALSGGRVGVAARGTGEADNLSAAALYRPNTDRAPTPKVGELAPRYSDEFDDAELEEAGWRWVREDPQATEAGGAMNWPVQRADLVGTGNDAGVFLREAPPGDYVVETKLTIDLGVETVRNFQQGGLIVYENDDLFARLSHVAIWNTRQTEYGKEMPFADRLAFGGMLIGPSADTTYLRVAHTVDRRTGEHEYRAATRREGDDWIWGGTWTLPRGTEADIGLISHGKNDDSPSATSRFDYFRVYRPRGRG